MKRNTKYATSILWGTGKHTNSASVVIYKEIKKISRALKELKKRSNICKVVHSGELAHDRKCFCSNLTSGRNVVAGAHCSPQAFVQFLISSLLKSSDCKVVKEVCKGDQQT